MPLVLEHTDWAVWPGEEPSDHAALMRPAGGVVLRMWPVSRAVNSVKDNRPDLLVEVADAGPGPTGSAKRILNPT